MRPADRNAPERIPRDICGALRGLETAGDDSGCNIAAAAAVLKVLANDDRMAVLLCLAEQGETRFQELKARFGFSQPKLSQLLSRLRQEKFVTVRRDGHTAYYQLGSREARVLVKRLFALFSQSCAPH